MKKSEALHAKLHTRESIAPALAGWRSKGRRIVFTNGCFDLLHLGHVDYLSKAADLGDVLVIGLNTDASVKRLKGEHRPITDERSRASLLAALYFVDAVIPFEEPTPYELIQHIQPDVLVKGADYKRKEDIIGYDIVEAKGGEVKTIEFLPGYSTSLIEARIRQGAH
jgi:D-glycero-beta-D-manno-heptose 1-phosphate adenylyltransferase